MCVKQSGGEEEEDEAGSGAWDEEWSEKDRDRLAIKGLCLRAYVACECVKQASMGVLSQRGNKDAFFFTIQRNIVTETLNFYPPERQRRAGTRLCLPSGEVRRYMR